MKCIPLLLMGCGGVGRQLLHHVASCRSLQAKQGVGLRVVGVCDSKSLLVAPDVLTMELDDTFLMEVCRVKSNGSSLLTLSNVGKCEVFTNPESMRKVTDIAARLGKSTGLMVVDCSASSETIGVLNQVVDFGCCVVLANKKPLSSSMEDFKKLFSRPRHIRHESTVGAGLPVIASLNRMISSGDPIHRIIGSLSGTLGYVMSEVEDGKLLSEVVKAAKDLGYTEPDPRDDLSGMDVARKGLILARLIGYHINMDNIKIESLYPDTMGPNVMSVEDFVVNGLPLLDKDIEGRVKKASSNGNVLRYVCVIENSRLVWSKAFYCFGFEGVVPFKWADFISIQWQLKGNNVVLRVIWKFFVHAIAWLLWMERSRRIFEDICNNANEIWSHACFLVGLWAKAANIF